MTPKSDAAAAERKVMVRYWQRLERAHRDEGHDGESAQDAATLTLAILKASAAALYPGDQQRKHLLPALGKMVTASCRVIRKSGK